MERDQHTQPHIDKVARAICLHRTEPDRHPTAWEDAGPELKDHYRRMAEAAIAALQQEVVWGVGIDTGSGLDVNANVCRSEADARKLMRSLQAIFPDDRRRIVCRLDGSPWRLVGPWGVS